MSGSFTTKERRTRSKRLKSRSMIVAELQSDVDNDSTRK